MDITANRQALAALLADKMGPEGISVSETAPDQMATPAVVVWATFGDERGHWLVPDTLCGGKEAQWSVILIAGRFSLFGQIQKMESMVNMVTEAVEESKEYLWTSVDPPGPMEMGGVSYLGAVVTVTSIIE